MSEAYVRGLPEASGTFTGTFDSAGYAAFASQVPELMAIDIDTGDQTNPAIAFLTEFTIRYEDQEWVLPVDHVDLSPGSNKVRVWVRRPERET